MFKKINLIEQSQLGKKEFPYQKKKSGIEKKEFPYQKKKSGIEKKEFPFQKKEPSVSPVVDKPTTSEPINSDENLPDIKVINVKDKYPEELEIKLFDTYYGKEGFFVKDYSFVKAVQEALNNTDKNKNLPGSNFVPGWED